MPASALGAKTVVESGPLAARVKADPWSLELVDARGRRVLREDRRREPSVPGALGFRTASGWQHASRVLSSARENGTYTATLATTDPERTIAVTLEPFARGSIALTARLSGPASGIEGVGIGFDARAGERYVGFGERSNAVDQSGAEVEAYVADGPYQDSEYPVIGLFVPAWGLRENRPDATYFPIPWLLSSAGYGVLVDNPETSVFRLRSAGGDAWSVEVTKAPPGEPGAELAPPVTELRMRFFAGPHPVDALRRFTAAVGRQPRAAAPWVYGPWFQPGSPLADDLALLRDVDAPVSVAQTYTHYLPCGDQNPAAERERIAAAHGSGVAITTYFNPMVCTDYAAAYGPAAAAGALTVNRLGEPYLYRYGADVDEDFSVSQYDFFTEAGRAAYAERLGEAIADGYDGWMEDFGEYTPLDSVSAGDIDGARAHNAYAARYHCAAWSAVQAAERPIVRFQRSGWTGAAPCAQVVWGGDPTTGWGFDGLRSAVTQMLNAGLSGIAIWGSDIGGFFALFDNQLTPELLSRWVEFGAVSPVMRTQRNGVAVPSRPRPQVTDPDQIAIWRRYAKLHTQLYPYLLAAETAYRRTGTPIARHLVLAEPTDPRAAATDDAFLFGPDLLAAPVLEPGATERSVYLPRGRWVDLWRSADYVERSGGLRLGRARVLAGRRDVVLPAPLEELPLLVRAGAVIPLVPPGVDTLAGFGDPPGVTTLSERRGRLRLLAFPRGRSRSAFGRRGEIVSRTAPESWTLRLRASQRTRWQLQAALSTARESLRPCGVTLDGRPLADRRWRFDRRSGVLEARFAGRNVELAASERGCR